MSLIEEYRGQITALKDIGGLFYDRGWSVGTSSNYSIVVSREPYRLLITASGKDKGRLNDTDFVLVDAHGKIIEGQPEQPSAETLLHVMATRNTTVNSVLHTHSVWATVLSDLFHEKGAVEIEGYEMLKGLAGITTHDTKVSIDIFENTQDIPTLAMKLEQSLPRYGFLLRRHGLYSWGKDVFEARRHIEVIEFLLEVIYRQRLSV